MHLKVIELSQQNTQLEEEALSLEQKLGDAENAVEENQKKVCVCGGGESVCVCACVCLFGRVFFWWLRHRCNRMVGGYRGLRRATLLAVMTPPHTHHHRRVVHVIAIAMLMLSRWAVCRLLS